LAPVFSLAWIACLYWYKYRLTLVECSDKCLVAHRLGTAQSTWVIIAPGVNAPSSVLWPVTVR